MDLYLTISERIRNAPRGEFTTSYVVVMPEDHSNVSLRPANQLEILLHKAAHEHNLGGMIYSLEHGASPHVMKISHGFYRTSLHWAIEHGDPNMVKHLLAHGHTPNFMGYAGEGVPSNPFVTAKIRGLVRCAKLLSDAPTYAPNAEELEKYGHQKWGTFGAPEKELIEELPLLKRIMEDTKLNWLTREHKPRQMDIFSLGA